MRPMRQINIVSYILNRSCLVKYQISEIQEDKHWQARWWDGLAETGATWCLLHGATCFRQCFTNLCFNFKAQNFRRIILSKFPSQCQVFQDFPASLQGLELPTPMVDRTGGVEQPNAMHGVPGAALSKYGRLVTSTKTFWAPHHSPWGLIFQANLEGASRASAASTSFQHLRTAPLDAWPLWSHHTCRWWFDELFLVLTCPNHLNIASMGPMSSCQYHVNNVFNCLWLEQVETLGSTSHRRAKVHPSASHGVWSAWQHHVARARTCFGQVVGPSLSNFCATNRYIIHVTYQFPNLWISVVKKLAAARLLGFFKSTGENSTKIVKP